jgi:hypothetical protein
MKKYLVIIILFFVACKKEQQENILSGKLKSISLTLNGVPEFPTKYTMQYNCVSGELEKVWSDDTLVVTISKAGADRVSIFYDNSRNYMAHINGNNVIQINEVNDSGIEGAVKFKGAYLPDNIIDTMWMAGSIPIYNNFSYTGYVFENSNCIKYFNTYSVCYFYNVCNTFNDTVLMDYNLIPYSRFVPAIETSMIAGANPDPLYLLQIMGYYTGRRNKNMLQSFSKGGTTTGISYKQNTLGQITEMKVGNDCVLEMEYY